MSPRRPGPSANHLNGYVTRELVKPMSATGIQVDGLGQ